MVSLILLGVFLLFVAFSAFVGFVRGRNKSVIRLITLAFAMVLTFVVSGFGTKLITEKVLIEGQTIGEFLLAQLSSQEMIVGFLESAPLFREAILVAPDFAIAFVLFPIAFLLISFLSWIVFKCIQKPLRKKMFKEQFPKTRKERKALKKQTPFFVRVGRRFAGLGIGAITGALIFGMLFTPIFGIISILPENSALEDVIDTMVEQDLLDASTAQMIKDELAVRDGAIIKGYGYIGAALAGRLYLSAVSRFEYDGLKTNIPAEFDSVFSVAQVAIEGGLLKAVMNSQDMNGIFKVLADEEFVNELIGEMFKSQLFCAAIPEVMAMAMEGVALSLNVPANKEAVYDGMMDDIAATVKDADIDYAAIKAYEDAQIDSVALDEGEQPVIMTKEEYEAEIEKLVALTEKIAKIINTSVSGSNEALAGNVADQIVQGVKDDVIANGEEALNNYSSEGVKGAISEISADDINASEGSAQDLLDKLNNPEKFETNVATVESITNSIRESVKSAVADTSKAQETASTLASVVSNLAGAVESATDANGNMDIANLDFSKVADAVTSLQGSNLKDVGSSLLDVVVSGDLGETDMIKDTVNAIKDSYNNGEDIGGTINSAGSLIIIGTTMGNGDGGEGAKENIEKSFKDLVQNLNETTLKLLSTVLSEDSLVSMGVDRAYAAIAYDVVDALLRELMELKNSPNYDNEVNTVLSIYDIVSAGEIAGEKLGDLIRQVLKSQVVMNTLDRVSTDILSKDLLISLKVPEEFAQEICTAVQVCVDEMLAIRNADSAAYNEEIDALVSMFMALEGKDDQEQLADVVGQMLKSNVIMNMLERVADDILSPAFLVSLKVSEKYAEEICTAVQVCIDEMLAIRNADTAAYNAEIDAIVAMFVALEGKDDEEQLADVVRRMLKSNVVMNMLEKVSDDILSPEFLISLEVSEKYAEEVCTTVQVCIDEMLAIRGKDVAAYEAEIDAIVDMLMTLKDKDLSDKAVVKDIVDFAKDSDVLYNVLMKISETVVIEMEEDDRADIAKGIENYYAESEKTEKDRSIFNAVAKIFGVQVTLQ